jgi:hypothetical protein
MRLILNGPSNIDRIAFSKLEEENIAEVVCCLTWQSEEELDWKENFRKAFISNSLPLFEDALAGEFSKVNLSLFTPEIQAELSWAENIVFEMMNRMDTLKSQTYFQRKNVYRYFVCYWIQKINELKPDAFYSKLTPHEVTDFILFALCKYYVIKVIIFSYTSFHGHLLVIDDYRQPWPILNKNLNLYRESPDKYFKQETITNPSASAYVNKLKGDYKLAKPTYEVFYDQIAVKKGDGFNLSHFVSRFFTRLRSFLRLTQFIFQASLEKRPTYKKLMDYVLSTVITREGKELKSLYKRAQTTDITIDSPYIYFPLHFQPEMTTSPQGGIFCDQHLALATLSSAIPDNWKIYVKEHPGQFRTGRFFSYAYNGRDKTYYNRLLSIPKVSLIPIETEHFNMLDHAEAIATITGTVGWEAAIRSKPVIIFGEAWYQFAPNVYRVKSLTDCKKAVNQLQNSPVADPKEMNTFINVLLSSTVNIFFDDLEAKWAEEEFDLQENAERLYNIIKKELQYKSSSYAITSN